MRKGYFLWLAVWTLCFWPYALQAAPLSSMAAFRYAPIQTLTTAKNTPIWLMEEHSAPILVVQIAFTHAGLAYDPEKREGLVKLTSLMLEKGAGNLDEKAFKKELETYAISLSFRADEDTFFITLETLSAHKQNAFSLLKTVLTSPALEKEALLRAKAFLLSLQSKQLEDPTWRATEAWRSHLFAHHPYGHPYDGTATSLEAITREDIRTYLRDHFTADHALVSVVGDIDKPTLAALSDTLLSALQDQAKPTASLPSLKPFPKGETVFLHMDIPQAVAIFGKEGIARKDPDFYAAYVLNHILGGGGLESRLMKEIREKHGLAYSVYTYLDWLEYAPTFRGMVATDARHINTSLRLLRESLTQIQRDGVTAKELESAKDYLVFSFPVRMNKNEDIAFFLNKMQVDGIEPAFLTKREHFIRAVTMQDIKRVAARFLAQDQLVTVVVGPVAHTKE